MNAKVIFLIAIITAVYLSLNGQNNVGVGTKNPHPSAKLEIVSPDKGISIPVFSSQNRNDSISSPAQGLVVYNSTTRSFWKYNGSRWKDMAPLTLDSRNHNLYGGFAEGTGLTSLSMKNTLLGFRAGILVQGSENTLIGYQAGERLRFGNRNGNTLVGFRAGRDVRGDFNTLIGREAGNNIGGNKNLFLGSRSGWKMPGGERNIFLGVRAGSRYPNSANFNIWIGYGCGEVSTGNSHDLTNSIFIGRDVNNATIPNHLRISQSPITTTTEPLIHGDFAASRFVINYSSRFNYDETFCVNGEASKATPGNFLANSDARLKCEIDYLSSGEILQKVLQMKGVFYEWKDTQTGVSRPNGVQTGFIAQNLQEVWPSKITQDAQGFLMAAYGEYDPMFVEAIKAQYQIIQDLERENIQIESRIIELENLLNDLPIKN